MQSDKMKIVILFAACGLFSGLLTVLFVFVTPSVIWFGIGIFFFLALTTGFVIGRINKWFSFPQSIWRYIVSSLTVISAYPLAFAAMILSAIGYSSLYFALSPTGWRERADSGYHPMSNDGLLLGLVIAALVSATLVSIALKIITQKWDKRAAILMMLAGIITLPVSAIISTLIGNAYIYMILFPVGELFFGGVSGYWLQRTTPDSE